MTESPGEGQTTFVRTRLPYVPDLGAMACRRRRAREWPEITYARLLRIWFGDPAVCEFEGRETARLGTPAGQLHHFIC